MTYKEKTIEALKRLGGHGYLEDIYSSFQSIENVTLPKSWHAIIRATIERSSSDTDTFDGKDDLFYSVEGVAKDIGVYENTMMTVALNCRKTMILFLRAKHT